jgi:hypothetical protein
METRERPARQAASGRRGGGVSVRAERIRLYHRAHGTDQPWSLDRLDRLCRLLSCLPDELGALAAVPPNLWAQYLRANRIPPHVALTFVGLERAYLAAVRGAENLPVIPVSLLQ